MLALRRFNACYRLMLPGSKSFPLNDQQPIYSIDSIEFICTNSCQYHPQKLAWRCLQLLDAARFLSKLHVFVHIWCFWGKSPDRGIGIALFTHLIPSRHHDNILFCWETMYHVVVYSCRMKGK